ncbi:MAG: glycosyltransferase family 4 protein [bacterium]|nr:glycosyltransferase family 4 protein [bacterium]
MQIKRILIFSLAYTPYVGGAEIAIKEITNRIGAGEYAFDLITLRFDRNLSAEERIGNVNVYRVGFALDAPKVSDRSLPYELRLAKILFPFTSFFKALSLSHRHRYDLIWTMMANQAGFGALFFKLTHPRIPYLLELQDGNSLEQVKKRRPILRLLWPLYRMVYTEANAIKAISNFIERLTRDVGYHGRVEIIPNGVDVAKFSAPVPEHQLQELRARYEKRLGDIFLFTASRLVLSRGVEDVIRALRHLPLEVKFLIAGDGEDREKLERIAKESGVESRVLFAGHVGHADLPAFLKISDIFVRPSIIEGMGSAFIEAFAAGIPVVATPVGGIPDFLFDPERTPGVEQTGVFCNVRDPESVARAVKRYLDDPALVATVVKNARALVEHKYDWDMIAADMRTKLFDPLTKS